MRFHTLLLFIVSAAIAAAQYPGAVAAPEDLKIAANNLAVTLRGSISSADATITLSDTSRITAGMLLTIDKEIVNVTAVSSPTVTVQRGYDGTTAVAHSSGRSVEGLIVAAHHNILAREVRAIETALGPNMVNIPGAAAGLINWSQTPGGSLTSGILNLVTLAPCPVGVAGANSGHYLRIAGGTGSAESVLIAGGTCTSGASSGTVIFTPANNHTGAWTIGTASGGLQEMICALPLTGGEALVTSSVTLQANVSACGKWPLTIRPAAGAAINWNGNKILGNDYYAAYIGTAGPGNVDPRSVWRLSTNAPSGTRLTGVNGIVDAPANSTYNEATGVFGHATSASPLTPGVGIAGWFRATGPGTDAAHRVNGWGINTLADDGDPVGANFAYVQLLNEYDFNVFNSSTVVLGSSIGGASDVAPATALGYICNQLGNPGTPIPWDVCLYTFDGTAKVGMQLGTRFVGNNTGSQVIQWFNRKSDGTQQVTQVSTDANGNMLIVAPTGIVMGAGGVAQVVGVSATGIDLHKGLNIFPGGHINGTSTNHDTAGQLIVSASTSAAHTFGTAWNAAPTCTVTPTSDPGAVTYWVTSSTTAFTVHLSTSSSITFMYTCVGNPS